MTARAVTPPVTDTGIELRPDPSRTVVRFFVPGNEDAGPGDSRAAPVVERVLGLGDDEVAAALRAVDDAFAGRHRDLDGTFDRHADLVTERLDAVPAPNHRRLLGAAFTHEFAVEGAALCNPSAVLHPDQPDDGSTRLVLSVRAIGEGHRSSVGFRTGTVDAAGGVTIDAPGPFPTLAACTDGMHHRAVVHRKLEELHDDHENASYVLDSLPDRFHGTQLRDRIEALAADGATRRHTVTTIDHLRQVAASSYRAVFDPVTELSERVLWPQSPAERNGMEDARFVRVTDASAPTYCATYTAYDGAHIAQHLITTEDFASFEVTPMAGRAARGKGLALFPRLVGGRHVALSRADRETNSVAYSDDLRCWDTSETIQTPVRSWEVLQLGNCGSPIETDEGWLVLTHGVGPMRTYALGAVLLDLDEPHRVVASSDDPILTPGPGRREGYVPNVVYSCGAVAVGDLLVLPYGVGDQTIRVATLSITGLVASMRR